MSKRIKFTSLPRKGWTGLEFPTPPIRCGPARLVRQIGGSPVLVRQPIFLFLF